MSLNKLFFVVVAMWVVDAHGGSMQHKTEKIEASIDGEYPLVAYTTKTIKVHSAQHNSVKNIFVTDPASHWIFGYSKNDLEIDLDEKNVSLLITFPKPLYVKKIRVVNGCPKSSVLNYGTPKSIYIERLFSPRQTFTLGDTYMLKDTNEPQVFSFEKGQYSWPELFRTNQIIIHVTDVYGGKTSTEVCVSKIGFEYSNEQTYRPAVQWAALKALILSKITFIKDKKWDSVVLQNDKNSFDFLYYVVSGNVEAKKLFDDYMPMSTVDSEAIDFVYRPTIDALLSKRK